jgi:hypothetical protein
MIFALPEPIPLPEPYQNDAAGEDICIGASLKKCFSLKNVFLNITMLNIPYITIDNETSLSLTSYLRQFFFLF